MSDETACWFCDDEARGEPPPGGWLVDDGTWRAGHVPAGYAVAGTVVLEARRHVLDQATMDARELSSLAAVTGRLVAAVRQVTGAERVYQWSSMDRFPHFHVWLLPWSASAGTRGPAYLAAATAQGCEEATARETAALLRAALD